jgi:ribonuclease VapC
MVIDTSAVLAILLDEPERRDFVARIAAAEHCFVSAALVLEATIALERRFDVPIFPELDEFLRVSGCSIVPVTPEQIGVARGAFRLYGKGRHRAGLNFGDCFSYALAKITGEPLLFSGSAFSLTDITPAVPQP